MTKAGDQVLEWAAPHMTRGELSEMLAELLLSLSRDGRGDTARLSDGTVCDAMLFAIDAIATTEAQKSLLKRQLADSMESSGILGRRDSEAG